MVAANMVESTWESMAQELLGNDYRPLMEVLLRAAQQAAYGKGFIRHSDGKPFMEQPWRRSACLFGSGFLLGQADKKIEESLRLDVNPSVQELLGAIVHLSMAIIHMEER